MSTRGCTPPRFARREFLLGLGAGVPLIGAACVEGDLDEFRDGEFEFGENVIPPLMGQGLAPQHAQVSLAVDVEGTVNGQDFNDDEFACSVPQSMPGVQVGDQVRISRNGQHFALYNVAERRQSDNPDVIRMGSKARQRLGTNNTFSASLDKPVPRAGMTDAQAEASNEFVERLVDDGSNDGLIVIAPHGGGIERGTCRQAEFVTAALSCSSWICKGFKSGGGCYTRWHITATKISPRSFPGLALIANRGFAYSVAFHGMSDAGILIGGAGPMDLKQMIRDAILDELSDNDIEVVIAGNNDSNSGKSNKNVVNWLTAGGMGGIQLEQSMKVRTDHWQEVAQAIINVYSDLI